MLLLWFNGFLVILVFLTLLWLLSVVIKNASIIDPFWGTGFVILIGFYIYYTGNINPQTILLGALTAIWGLRLSIYLLIRNWGKPEDYRYQQFRQDYGAARYWWFSFFQVFLLQGVLMCFVSLPLLTVVYNSTSVGLLTTDYIVLAIWSIGFVFEALGDYQLAQHKKKTTETKTVLRTGLWKYTRHPNYFGNAVIWWSFGLLAVFNNNYVGIIGPLIMTILLLKVSGVSMLERTLKISKPEYADYIESTSAFIPWFPKKPTDNV